MSLHEITLPETEPETEWVLGQPIQKVSPTYWHASLQFCVCAALREWAEAGGHGRVAPEWRFRVTPPGEAVRPLVPDVAYLAYATVSRDAPPSAFQVPIGAPTVAVEILSPDDRPAVVANKIKTYLLAGSELIAIVDPQAETITLHDSDASRMLRAGDCWTHAALPGFLLDVAELFERAKRR